MEDLADQLFVTALLVFVIFIIGLSVCRIGQMHDMVYGDNRRPSAHPTPTVTTNEHDRWLAPQDRLLEVITYANAHGLPPDCSTWDKHHAILFKLQYSYNLQECLDNEWLMGIAKPKD